MAKEATIVASVPRNKTQAWTRKKLNRRRREVERERKAQAKAAFKSEARALRNNSKATSVFEGVDPERTLALIGEEV